MNISYWLLPLFAVFLIFGVPAIGVPLGIMLLFIWFIRNKDMILRFIKEIKTDYDEIDLYYEEDKD